MTPSMSKGGAETQLLKLAIHLSSHGHEVLIISLKPINGFGDHLKNNRLNILLLKSWLSSPFSNCIDLWKAVKTFRPDVIIAFMFIAIIFARLLKLSYPFKLISTIRISVINKKWHLPFRITAGLDDAVVYNSKASKLNFERQHLVRKKGIVINNAISIPALNIHPYRSSTIFTWVCVAHFRWNKDYMTLFKAIALIKDLDFKLEVIGALNNEVWPYQMIKNLDIENHVRLLGFKQDASAYLQTADAFVLSSHSEGMPNAVLEAMAHARPIVVTAIEVNIELLEAAQCGFLSDKENEHHLAGKLRHMMEMTIADRQALGRNGQQYIEANFNERTVMEQWMQLINQHT